MLDRQDWIVVNLTYMHIDEQTWRIKRTQIMNKKKRRRRYRVRGRNVVFPGIRVRAREKGGGRVAEREGVVSKKVIWEGHS